MTATAEDSADESRSAPAPAIYACPILGCERLFKDTLSRTHHLSSIHALRSTATEATGRQERRDQIRTVDDFRSHFRRHARAKPGSLDAGEIEYVRRRLIYVAEQLAADLRREPAEVCVAAWNLFAVSFDSRGLAAIRLDADRVFTASSFTQRAPHKHARRELVSDST